jgi:hypothetical protein
MAKYKIEVPNKMYNGITEGVPFVDGFGETDDENIKNVLINDFGYTLCCDDVNAEDKAEDKKPAKSAKSSDK